MKRVALLLFAGALALASAAAGAQTPMRIRGIITSVEGDVLSVKTRDGKDLKINLAPNAAVVAAKAVALADFKPGAYVGSTAKKNARFSCGRPSEFDQNSKNRPGWRFGEPLSMAENRASSRPNWPSVLGPFMSREAGS